MLYMKHDVYFVDFYFGRILHESHGEVTTIWILFCSHFMTQLLRIKIKLCG